jgi:hypothetical protein
MEKMCMHITLHVKVATNCGNRTVLCDLDQIV